MLNVGFRVTAGTLIKMFFDPLGAIHSWIVCFPLLSFVLLFSSNCKLKRFLVYISDIGVNINSTFDFLQ